jgi:hypothetical protein
MVQYDTVFKIKKRWEQEGTLRRKVGSGRPKISNNVEDLRLITYLEENPFNTARDSIVNTHFPGSPTTACQRIKNSDIGNYAAAKKMILRKKVSNLGLIRPESSRPRHGILAKSYNG